MVMEQTALDAKVVDRGNTGLRLLRVVFSSSSYVVLGILTSCAHSGISRRLPLVGKLSLPIPKALFDLFAPPDPTRSIPNVMLVAFVRPTRSIHVKDSQTKSGDQIDTDRHLGLRSISRSPFCRHR